MTGSDEPPESLQPPDPAADDDGLDLTTIDQLPGPPLRIRRHREEENAQISMELRLGPLSVALRHRTRGLVSWIGPLTVGIIALALVAAVAVSRVVLTEPATNIQRIAAAATTATVVLLVGFGITLIIWRKRSTD